MCECVQVPIGREFMDAHRSQWNAFDRINDDTFMASRDRVHKLSANRNQAHSNQFRQSVMPIDLNCHRIEYLVSILLIAFVLPSAVCRAFPVPVTVTKCMYRLDATFTASSHLHFRIISVTAISFFFFC